MTRLLALLAASFIIISATIPARSETVVINENLTIHYETAGKGDKTLLFIPGWTMSSEVFDRQLEHYAASEEFRVIAYDPRAQGRSSKTVEGHHYDQRGKDLAALIEKLDLDNIVIVGWSFGVLDQFSYISQFGHDKVLGVVLIDGTPKTLGDDNAKEWVWFNRTDSDGFRKWGTMAPIQDRAAFNIDFAKWMVKNADEKTIAWISGITNMTSNTVAALTNETGAYADYAKALIELEGKKPILVVVREEWKEIASNWTKANTPSATVVGLGKHLMFWEDAEQFNAILDGYLAGL